MLLDEFSTSTALSDITNDTYELVQITNLTPTDIIRVKTYRWFRTISVRILRQVHNINRHVDKLSIREK